jgi:hypothetical protein
MAQEIWQAVKVIYCERAGCEVSYQIQVAFPAEIMPDQPPRILARRCSHGMECNLSSHPGCIWSGTNPSYDPFA